MAKEYFKKLIDLLDELDLDDEVRQPMEVKHFFSGAALYAEGRMCVSWSPVGLAFRLPDHQARRLIDSGKAIPLKYFPNGHIKKGYALFENPGEEKPEHWKNYLITATRQT